MKKKVFSMALGALAGLFLAVSPVAAADTPVAGPGDWLRAAYQNVLEWFAALSEGAETSPADVPPAEGNNRTGEPSGGAEPELAPYIPPTG